MLRLFSLLLPLFWTKASAAETVKLLVGKALPPYICMEQGRGLELDIVRAALAHQNIALEPVFVPLARIARQLNTGQFDGALTLSESLELEGVHLSEPHIRYHNIAVTLADSQLKLEHMRQLQNKTVVAFQNATHYLGPQFALAVKNSPYYREYHNQALQVAMLFKRRTQVIVLDYLIFNYYRSKLPQTLAGQAVEIHQLFGDNAYRVGFLQPGLRDAFNRGLTHLFNSGRYQQIQSHYFECFAKLKSARRKSPQSARCGC
ncbi:MAG: transporter substrate-binding domain-containing protein [Cellvibrionaceae bacterium]|nr:transporter substrate-binding domain-containing protein [Cellvibrionaceae bacterium]